MVTRNDGKYKPGEVPLANCSWHHKLLAGNNELADPDQPDDVVPPEIGHQLVLCVAHKSQVIHIWFLCACTQRHVLLDRSSPTNYWGMRIVRRHLTYRKAQTSLLWKWNKTKQDHQASSSDTRLKTQKYCEIVTTKHVNTKIVRLRWCRLNAALVKFVVCSWWLCTSEVIQMVVVH